MTLYNTIIIISKKKNFIIRPILEKEVYNQYMQKLLYYKKIKKN